jgi:uncharacterized protein (TIGR03066 family)
MTRANVLSAHRSRLDRSASESLTLLVCCEVSADDKIDAKKLVGKWTPKKEPGAMVVEFAGDGKMTVTTVIDGKENKMEGSYKVDGKKLVLTVKAGEKEVERTRTIFDLTDTELITSDENGKKEFAVRVKDK